ncbi:hypothetical protein MRX96_043134 [Rhipicephalus microplus]
MVSAQLLQIRLKGPRHRSDVSASQHFAYANESSIGCPIATVALAKKPMTTYGVAPQSPDSTSLLQHSPMNALNVLLLIMQSP